jgi:nucleoside-diphosphate-sugar epimerase
MKKCLITGGAGFVGFHLAKSLLESKKSVYLFDNFTRGKQDDDYKELMKNDNVFLLNRDITDPSSFEDLNNFDEVYHFAALNGTENFYNYPDKVIKVGVIGTINLLDWFKNQNKGILVFSSSSETYAGAEALLGKNFPIPTPENIPLVISDPRNTRWSYGGSKILGEILMFSYMKKYELADRIAIIRFHNIYGPRMGFEHVIPQFIERIIRRENPFQIFGSNYTRAFCYVDDAVKSINCIVENSKSMNKIINIGKDDEEIKIIDLAKKLFKIENYEVPIIEKKSPEGSVLRRCPDISKLKDLGFTPTISLDSGLSKTYKWYNKYYKM